MARRDGALDGNVWRAAGEISESLAAAQTAEQLGQEVMGAVNRMVECDIGSILSAAPGREWITAGQIEDTRVITENHWRYAMEMTPVELQRLGLRFTRDREIFEPNRRDRMSIYQDFLMPNAQSGFVARYWFMDGRLWGMGLSRAASFSERDRDRLDALFPQIRAAMRASAWLVGEAASARNRDAWSLTRVEARTMELVVRGLTNVEVAGLLGISRNTVRNTLAQVFKKVGVSRRTELAFVAASGFDEEAQRLRNGRLYDRQLAVSAAIDPGAAPGADRRR
jgi:DNA-binding CsgD family transcriptional regulator